MQVGEGHWSACWRADVLGAAALDFLRDIQAETDGSANAVTEMPEPTVPTQDNQAVESNES